MKQYIELLTTILKEGRIKTDRTGTGTISIFGYQTTFYMKDGFPLLTLKKTYPKGVFEELFWFLKGDTNIKYLNKRNVHIWDEWADKNGDLGPIYGKQWVDWGSELKLKHFKKSGNNLPYSKQVPDGGINQIQNIINQLKTNPDSRRLICSAWNVSELEDMALTPCHVMFQFITEPLTLKERFELYKEKYDECKVGDKNYDKRLNYEWIRANITDDEFYNEKGIPKFRLSLQLYQRSQDHFLGAPFNIASYSLLLHMVAQISNMIPYKFVHTTGDAHLYLNHKNQVNELLKRTVKPNNEKEDVDYWEKIQNGVEPRKLFIGTKGYGPKLPKIKLNPDIKNIFDFKIDDVELIDYNPLPAIRAKVSV